MGTRPGPVKDEIAAFQGGFAALLRQLVVTAQELGELHPDEDPDTLAFELNGVMYAANASFVLRDDPKVLDMARQIVRRRLGIDDGRKSAARSTSKKSKRTAASISGRPHV
jgi:hypothetical protein